MADINAQYTEQQHDVDWDAPESGTSFPPPAAPGDYEFIFRLPEDLQAAFEPRQRKDPNTQQVVGVYPQVQFNVELLNAIAADGTVTPVPSDLDGKQPVVRFQKADLYRSDKMAISSGAELIRCLGLVDEVKQLTGGKLTPEVFETILKQADGRARGTASFKWRHYFKSSDNTVSTSPRRTRKGRELAWPRKADNSGWEEMAQDPTTGEKAYGRMEIDRYKLPKKS